MKYIFPVLSVLMSFYAISLNNNLITFVAMTWTLLSLVLWFTLVPVRGGRIKHYEHDRLTLVPLILGYIVGIYFLSFNQYGWVLSWVFAIHLYTLFHSRINYSPSEIYIHHRPLLPAMLLSLMAPVVLVGHLLNLSKETS